jgi:hypothetical protein
MRFPSPENFYDWLAPGLFSWVRMWSKIRPSLPASSADFITASFADGLVVNISSCKPEYKNRYYGPDKFKKNAVRLAAQLTGGVKEYMLRHGFKSMYIDITIKCDGLEYVAKMHICNRMREELPTHSA